jgi:hypothetical protein
MEVIFSFAVLLFTIWSVLFIILLENYTFFTSNRNDKFLLVMTGNMDSFQNNDKNFICKI